MFVALFGVFYCIERLFCIIQRDEELKRQHRGEATEEEEKNYYWKQKIDASILRSVSIG
jgi:hypothetical protein